MDGWIRRQKSAKESKVEEGVMSGGSREGWKGMLRENIFSFLFSASFTKVNSK